MERPGKTPFRPRFAGWNGVITLFLPGERVHALGDEGKDRKRPGTVVYETVAASLGAVVAAAGVHGLLSVLEEHLSVEAVIGQLY